ncbi:MAG TPA: nucleoside-diphosphate sugar epimerase/dehydratase [Terriglobales bacterium]
MFRLLRWAYQPVLIVLAYSGSFLLRFDFAPRPNEARMFWQSVFAVILIKVVVFRLFGLSRGWWRYAGLNDLVEIGKAALVSTAVLSVLFQVVHRPVGFPRSIFGIDFALTILVAGGARFAFRAWREILRSKKGKCNTLIVGAGETGGEIVRDLRRNPGSELRAVGFVDDNPNKLGVRIHGVKVLGTTEDLEKLIHGHLVQRVLIAISTPPGAVVERVVSQCKRCKVDFSIVPSLHERLNGRVSVDQLRDVRLEDLLGRKPVRLDLHEIETRFCDSVVLVTGAGGSIGSELVKQLAGFRPKRIVMLDRAENDLFKISLEMSRSFPRVECVPAIGDILDARFLRDVFSQHRPSCVFHAAAYKHVPLMEKNCCQAVTNNVFGTYNVALTARHYGVSEFVMISSDKAVRPTNVMGVTKRLAELIIVALQGSATRFMAVRFGNVLGSNGSVVPIFQQQIALRTPITVTHPDVSRYFMTIPEAVQLVLQASTMGEGGEIFMLNMGEPVRIVDLAKRLVQLSGVEPSTIPIIFTGLRPGEKLHEELMLDTEGIIPTTHEDIMLLRGQNVAFTDVRQWLEKLMDLIEGKNVYGVVRQIRAIVPEYTPSPEVLSASDLDRHDVVTHYLRDISRAESANVAA